ncbi:MAG: pyrroline-5-carboxylate reductase [Candidatus Adiutrix sp.]|jgi:pyrroline-5-carboxylate reductase|nr:pyrroline-5-carboxylate reductase [Candidatus Adiutrix sp.]
MSKVGFLGYGNMARAISEGLDRAKVVPFAEQAASGRDRERLARLTAKNKIYAAADNIDLLRAADVIILGVKPAQTIPLLRELAGHIRSHLFISMAAGLSLNELVAALPSSAAAVRTMPNIAALSGRGVTVMCAPPGAPAERLSLTRRLFQAVGLTLELEEKLFDAATAVSGSGPAYFLTIMEALTAGGVRLGLPRETARAMVMHTALGAAHMALDNPGQTFAALRDLAVSPGGTTAEGLYVMERGAVGGTLLAAVEAAAAKSAALGIRGKNEN